jgi:hypothetical protein
LGWWLQHDTIALGFYFWPALLGAGVFVAIIGRAIAKDFPIGKMLFVSCFSVAIFFLYLKIDPGDFLSWYWD